MASLRKTPAPPPTCRSLEESTHQVHSNDSTRFHSKSYLQATPDFLQQFPKNVKLRKNTLAGDRKGKLRFWHSGNERQGTGSYVSSNENTPCQSQACRPRGRAVRVWLASGPGPPALVGTASKEGVASPSADPTETRPKRPGLGQSSADSGRSEGRCRGKEPPVFRQDRSRKHKSRT